MGRAYVVGSVCLVSLLAASGRAGAAEPRFGAAGEWLLLGTPGVSVSSATYDGSDAIRVSANLSPHFDYFVVDHLAIGATFGVDYSDAKGYAADASLVEITGFGWHAGLNVGYDVPLSELLSLFPRFTFGVAYSNVESSLVPLGNRGLGSAAALSPSNAERGLWLELMLPLLVHPTPRAFIGFGPSIARAPASGVAFTTFGSSLVVGGVWGGEPAPEDDAEAAPAAAPAPAAPSVPAAPFGEVGQFVFDTGLALALRSSRDDSGNRTGWSLDAEPGVDVFIARHLSLGGAGWASFSSSGSVNEAGLPTSFRSSEWGVEPRVGVQMPLGGGISFYPRIGLAVGRGAYTQMDRTGDQHASYTFASVHIDAPILIPLAPHLFAGLGPFLVKEAIADYAFDNGYTAQPRMTRYGLASVLGGWL